MDKLAVALGLDPIELRLRNALKPGDALITGQVLRGTAPVAEVIRTCAAAPLPAGGPTTVAELGSPAAPAGPPTAAECGAASGSPSGSRTSCSPPASTTTSRHDAGSRTASPPSPVPPSRSDRALSPSLQQITREVLGVDDVILAPADTVGIGSAGSTSASRQTWMSGGAVQAACLAVRSRLLDSVSSQARCRRRDARDRRRQGRLTRPGSRPSGR